MSFLFSPEDLEVKSWFVSRFPGSRWRLGSLLDDEPPLPSSNGPQFYGHAGVNLEMGGVGGFAITLPLATVRIDDSLPQWKCRKSIPSRNPLRAERNSRRVPYAGPGPQFLPL